MLTFRSMVNGASVKFPDVNVALAGDKASAEVLLTVKARVPTDPDTVISVLTLGLASGASIEAAAVVANCAAGIVVGKLGTATVSAEELIKALAQ